MDKVPILWVSVQNTYTMGKCTKHIYYGYLYKLHILTHRAIMQQLSLLLCHALSHH